MSEENIVSCIVCSHDFNAEEMYYDKEGKPVCIDCEGYINKREKTVLDEVLKKIDKIPNRSKGHTKYEFERILEKMKEER